MEVAMSVPTQPIEGYYYDELSKIRVLDPLVATETGELKEECKDFVDSKFWLCFYKCTPIPV